MDVYVRDSGGSRQEQSTDQQLRQVQTFCNEFGLQLRHRFIDEAKSGGTVAGRDEFNRMLALYEHEDQRPGGLLLWNYARFARDIDDAQLNKIIIRRWGIVIHSLNDSVPEGDYGRFIEFFIDMSNEEKRKQTSIDARRGLRELVQKYGCVPGPAPRGMLRERVEIGTHRDGSPRIAHRWIPDPETAPLVLKAFQMRAAGQSLGQIHKETRLYGSINSFATFWRNKIYIGILEFGDDLVIENYCAPIVPRELWERVREMQKKFSRFGQFKTPGSVTHPRRANSRFLLSGLLRCAHCGSAMYGHSSMQRNGHYLDDYNCPRAHRKRDCTRKRIPRQLIEDKILSIIRDLILVPDNLAAVQAELAANQADQLVEQTKREKEISRELGKIRRQINNVMDAIAESKHSPSLLKRLADLESKLADLRQRQSDLAMTALRPVPVMSPARLQTIIEKMNATLAHGSHEKKQALLRNLIDHIDIRREPDGLHGTLYYFYPPEPNLGSSGGDTVPTSHNPLGPLMRAVGIARRSCAIIANIKVRAGVVGHPDSEKGKQGGSPSRRKRDAIRTELACIPAREAALVNGSSQRRERPLQR